MFLKVPHSLPQKPQASFPISQSQPHPQVSWIGNFRWRLRICIFTSCLTHCTRAGVMLGVLWGIPQVTLPGRPMSYHWLIYVVHWTCISECLGKPFRWVIWAWAGLGFFLLYPDLGAPLGKLTSHHFQPLRHAESWVGRFPEGPSRPWSQPSRHKPWTLGLKNALAGSCCLACNMFMWVAYNRGSSKVIWTQCHDSGWFAWKPGTHLTGVMDLTVVQT